MGFYRLRQFWFEILRLKFPYDGDEPIACGIRRTLAANMTPGYFNRANLTGRY